MKPFPHPFTPMRYDGTRCRLCNGSRSNDQHDPDNVVQATDPSPTPAPAPEPSGREAANPVPSAHTGAQRAMVAERNRTPGHRPSAWSTTLGQALPRIHPGHWVRVRNTGSKWFNKLGLVMTLYLPDKGIFKDKWIVVVFIDHPLAGPRPLHFQPHELEEV